MMHGQKNKSNIQCSDRESNPGSLETEITYANQSDVMCYPRTLWCDQNSQCSPLQSCEFRLQNRY